MRGVVNVEARAAGARIRGCAAVRQGRSGATPSPTPLTTSKWLAALFSIYESAISEHERPRFEDILSPRRIAFPIADPVTKERME